MGILNINLTDNYSNNSQKVRIMTEFWTWKNIFCPNCWDIILQYENNRPVADFYCKNCKEDYELKSGKSIWNKITAWAYSTMVNRINSNKNPNFLFLNYNSNYDIKNFFVIPMITTNTKKEIPTPTQNSFSIKIYIATIGKIVIKMEKIYFLKKVEFECSFSIV